MRSMHQRHRTRQRKPSKGVASLGTHEKHARSCSTCCTEQCQETHKPLTWSATSQWLPLQATRARGQIIKELEKFFLDNNIDALLGPPLFLAYDGNLVGLPQIVVPTSFVPVKGTEGPRKDPRTMGIYAPIYQDNKVRSQAVLAATVCTA